MGKIVKSFFVIGIVALVVIFLVIGFQTAKSVDAKLASLEARVGMIDKKRDDLIQRTVSLEEVKNSLLVQIAMEKDKATQLELQKNLTALKQAAEDARQAELQTLSEARAKALAEVKLLQQQALAAGTKITTTRNTVSSASASSASQSSMTGATTATASPSSAPAANPSPAPAPAPTPAPAPPPPPPPKVTTAS